MGMGPYPCRCGIRRIREAFREKNRSVVTYQCVRVVFLGEVVMRERLRYAAYGSKVTPYIPLLTPGISGASVDSEGTTLPCQVGRVHCWP